MTGAYPVKEVPEVFDPFWEVEKFEVLDGMIAEVLSSYVTNFTKVPEYDWWNHCRITGRY